MGRIEQSIEVNASREACFEQWSRFEEFPRFMNNVEEIRKKGAENIWEWKVRGPLGQSVEWDAEMDARRKDTVISWHTVRDSQVGHAGAVTFDELAPDRTRVNVKAEYEAPGGALGDLVANIFKNPETMVKEDLENFKELVESRGETTRTGARHRRQEDTYRF